MSRPACFVGSAERPTVDSVSHVDRCPAAYVAFVAYSAR
jgi:hypothetical protein